VTAGVVDTTAADDSFAAACFAAQRKAPTEAPRAGTIFVGGIGCHPGAIVHRPTVTFRTATSSRLIFNG
jgi:sugar/nucleoside kinase (ribokinase family)